MKKTTTNENLLSEQKNVHSGHRERVRNKIREKGVSSLAEHEVLEYLLFLTTPRKDVNGLAHELIDKFGSFGNVLDANENDLLSVKGVTSITALFLSNFTSIYNRYVQSKENKTVAITTLRRLSEFFFNRIGNCRQEVLLIACFDIQMRLKRVFEYTSNNVKMVIGYPKQVLSDIAKTNCSFVAIGHNHPGGKLTPSSDDVEYTYNIIRQLNVIDVRFFDSIVVNHFGSLSILNYVKNKVENQEIVTPIERELSKIRSALFPNSDVVIDRSNKNAERYPLFDEFDDDDSDGLFESTIPYSENSEIQNEHFDFENPTLPYVFNFSDRQSDDDGVAD